MSIFQSVSNIKINIKYETLIKKSNQIISSLNQFNDIHGDIVNPDGRGGMEFSKSIRESDNFNNLNSSELAQAAANIKLQCRI